MAKVRIIDVVGSTICVAAEDGQRVNQEIARQIASKEKVILSFIGIERLTTAFLNAAIGQLYGEFSEEQIREFVEPPNDAAPVQLSMLKKVVERAKEYFKDPAKYKSLDDLSL